MPKAKPAKTYPDVTDLLAAHEAARRKLAALSWEEKVAIMERMRDDLYRWHQQGSQENRRGKRRRARELHLQRF